MANPAFGAPKPKPAVVVEEPKPAVTPPTAPLPEPPIAAEIEPEPVVAPTPKPRKSAAPVVTPPATPPVASVPSAAELLRESSAVNVIEPPKPKPAPKPSAASPMVETLATADYTDPMQAFADSIQVPLPTMRKRLLEFNADPENAGLPEDEWNRRAVDALIRISPRYDQLAAEPPKPPPLPTYGFAQTDGFVLWSAMRAEYEKEKYHGEKAKPPAQILIEYAQARGMKPAELAEAAKAAGTDLFAIQRVAREDRSKAESLAEFNRLRLGGRYTTPEKARQARVAEAVTKPPKEEDRSSLTVVMSNDIPFFAPLPDEDPELTHTAAGMRYAQDVIDHIPPSRNVIYDTGFQQYASDSRQVFLDAANDVLSHGVSFEVKGIIDGKPGKKVIRLTSNSAAAALQVMKDNGFDVSGPDAMKAAAAVGNEAKRRAVARAVNEVAAKQINGHFASPVRASIPFSQMTNLAPPGGYDPLSDDRDTMWLNSDAVDDARSMVQRGDYLGAASQALAPTLTIAGYADIPGSSAVWPVLVREESNLETAADWTDIPYAAGKGALEPVTEAWERGDYAEAAANLTLAGFGRVENGRIVARSPDEILAGVAAAVEHRENSFADLQESDILTKYIETTNYGLNLARKMDFGLPDRFDIDYNGDGKIDATDRERGWTEYQDFMTFGLQNLAAFGGAVATLDMFDVLGAMQAGKVIRRLNRAIEYKPAAVNLMDEAKKALVEGDFEAAQKAEEQLEFRPGHSREKAGPARAHPEGQAPILGQTSRVVDSVLAHEAHELGKADEMFDTAIEGALPDIDPVVTSGPTPSNRRFYLHGSVRTSAKQYLTTEDLRARYAFRHFYNIVESMEAAIADGRATYKTRLLRKFAKPIKEFVTQTGLTGDAADALRKLLRQNVASGYSPMQIDAVLRAHLKGDAYDLADKAATELAAAVAKEEADAVKEGRIAVERARRAVDQQVASRIASMQRTVDFVRGPEPGTAFGKWLHEKLPAVRNWFSRFREPENLVKVVESEVLQRATAVETPVDIPATVKRLDTEEQTIRARTAEVEAAQIAKDEAAEKKAKKLLKAATTRRNNAVKSIAAAINGRGHVLSDAGVEHFLRMRAADGGATDPAEIMFTTILIDLRAEKMVEEGTAKTLEEVHERFSWRRSDTVEPDALLQDRPLAPAFYSGLRKAVEDLRQERMSVDQFRAAVKKAPGVKQDEIDWTRLESFLSGKTSVTKTEALDWLDENAVTFDVKTLGDRDPAVIRRLDEIDERIAALEDSDYGNDVDAPDGSSTNELIDLRRERRRLNEQNPYVPSQYGEHTLPPADGADLARYEATGEPADGYREVLLYSPQAEGFESGHFGDRGKNLLAHMRLSDRTTADGKRILFAEEFQSDWHQAGREQGYVSAEDREAVRRAYEEATASAWRAYSEAIAPAQRTYNEAVAQARRAYDEAIAPALRADDEAVAKARRATAQAWRAYSEAIAPAQRAHDEAIDAALRAHAEMQDAVSFAPLSKSWHEQLLKRLVRMAAEEGYDGIGWTSGVQQVERYTDDFRQRVAAVDWYHADDGADVLTAKAIDRNDESVLTVDFLPSGQLIEPIRNGRAEAKTLADVFGREVANKILEDTKKAFSSTVEGNDLTVGGEGMKTFYDRIVPSFANDYARKNGWGAKVEMADIGVGDPVHVLSLTDAAKEHVLYRGQTLFQPGDTSILRQDETPDFIEPERLNRSPRVVRSETGEMVPLEMSAEAVDAYAKTFETLVSRLGAIDLSGRVIGRKYDVRDTMNNLRRRASRAKDSPGTLRQSLPAIRSDLEYIRDLDEAAVGAALDSLRRVEAKYPIVAPPEPLSVLPPQKVPTDPMEMTRVVRDTPWFHGAVRGEVQLREYDPSVHAGSSAGLMLGPGLYLAENPEVAVRYATAKGGAVGTAPGKAALKTIMVSPERLLDVRPIKGETYAETLARRLEAIGLTEDAQIVRDSRINGPYEIGEKWLNRRATVVLTPEQFDAASVIRYLNDEHVSLSQIRDMLSRVADVTNEPPIALLEEVRDAYRQADMTRARSSELYAKYASYTEIPEEVNDELTRLAHEQARLSAITEKMDGIVDILGRRGVIVEDEIRDIRTNEVLDGEEFNARWQKIVEAKKVLEGALEKAKNASSPTQRLLEHFDGLFHAGSQDGNVLVLFDPNGKIGGRSIINVESRVLPERVIYQTDDLAAAKAYVQFEADGKALVTLMKKADASSFIHETAHVFRRTLDEKDNATILRWTKAAGLDVELQNGLFVGPDAAKAEEMFARAFERFALEGKTPVKGLRRLFMNLRDVMLRIYRGSKALDVEISPEIEILFNRMISPKSVSTEVAPTIHTGATDMSAAKWLAGRSNGLLKPDELLAALEAGETVRLPFRVFGKDEIDINDLARLQVQIDTIAGSPEPVFKEPFKSARQQVVEPTLTGDIQSALSQDAPEGSIERVGFHMTRGATAVVLGADALAQERIFAPRFRELGQQGERLLNQRVGDMNVFLREQEIDDGRVPVIRYMTGQAQNFRVGGRTPLSAGHDAVAEVGEIIEESAAELAQIKIQVSNAIDEAYENSTGVAQYVGPGGQVTGNAAAAAPLGQLSQEVAVIARRVTELPTADQRSNEVSAFFNDRPDRQRMVRGVVQYLMTNGNVDKASATIFRHLGMALLNNGIMEGKSVDEVIRTAQVPKLLAYVDAVYRLGGFEVVDDMLVQNSRTSAERLQDFIQVLDNAGFGPEGIDRALVVVNAFGAQKSIYAHVSDFGAAFSKEEYAAFNRFLNGDFKSAADYANGLRMFKQFGFNHDALEEAAGLIEGSKSRYIPSNVQKRIGSALGRALDETTDQKNSQTPEAARWLLSFWQRQVVRGTLLPKAAKAWMDNMDTFFTSAVVGGVEVGARAAMRQGLQTLFIGTRGHLLGWLTRTIDEHGSATDRIRSGLQNFGDWMASPTGQQTVNKILKGSDEIYRTADGRVYRHSDFLTAAIRHGTVSSFETSVLRESIRRSREATFIADEVPTTVAGRMYDLARERASQASHGIKNTLTDILHANSELFEAWAERERMGVMVTFAEAGMTPDKAARKTVEALFDYPGSLAASELKGTFSGFMLTLVQPFWPFVKNANHFAINAIEKPEVLYRLTAMRRAVEYGQEAVAQTIYSFFVDPYGFDYAEMSPESRASYYMLRDAYEKSLGKLPHEMTVEERLKLAAIILSAQPESPFAVADGKHFRLPGGVSDITATEISRLPGGNAIASSYRPEPRLENVPPYMQRRIRTLFPARRTGAIESYIRATRQQDLQYAVAAFEPAPIAGMNYLANTLALYGYVGAVMTTEQSASAEQSLRAIREFADPERMPLVADIAATFQVGQPERVSYALAAAMQQHPDLASWVYPVYDERTIPMTEYELSLGVDPDAAGVRKPVRWYTVNPTLSLLLRTVLYDTNTTALNMQQPSGAFARETNLEALRKVLYLVGPLKITEESQTRAASRAYYDLPPDARPR